MEELRRELPDVQAANGFANRFLWFAVRRTKQLPNPQPLAGEVQTELAGTLAHALARARAIERLQRVVYGELAAEREGLAGALLARAEAHVLRLSMVYALLDASPAVSIEHLAAALELWAVVTAFDRGGAANFRRYLPPSLKQLGDDDLARPVNWPMLAGLEEMLWLKGTETAGHVSRGAHRLSMWWNAARTKP